MQENKSGCFFLNTVYINPRADSLKMSPQFTPHKENLKKALSLTPNPNRPMGRGIFVKNWQGRQDP